MRALAPFVAGSSGMRYRAFVPYSILGTGVWATAHILIGYFFSRSIDEAAKYAGRGAFLLATLIVVVVGRGARGPPPAGGREPPPRGRLDGAHGAPRWLVALGRRLQPQARFLWNRVTPGGTFGLEFTTLMAVLSVGLFVLVSYTVIVSGDPGPTPGDMTALDVAESIQVGLADRHRQGRHRPRLAGGGAAAGLVCAVALARARRWPEFWVLVAGMLIIFVGIDVLKEAVDRPRPARRPGRRPTGARSPAATPPTRPSTSGWRSRS